MTSYELFLDFVSKGALFCTVMGMTALELIPFLPIKPWTAILTFASRVMVGPLEAKVDDIKKTNDERWAERVRGDVLDFARACQYQKLHTRDEWERIIDLVDRYEDYIEQNNLPNGKFTHAANYLKERYKRRLEKNDFKRDEELYKS